MDLTLNVKLYHTKKLFEVNLHDIRRNTSPISQKTEVHFLRYLTPNMTMSSFFKISLTTFQYTEKTVYAIFRTLYEILSYPDALWTCLIVTNNLILYLLFYSHYTSYFSQINLFDNWYNFIHNTYEYLLMKSGCYWELTWFILSI